MINAGYTHFMRLEVFRSMNQKDLEDKIRKGGGGKGGYPKPGGGQWVKGGVQFQMGAGTSKDGLPCWLEWVAGAAFMGDNTSFEGADSPRPLLIINILDKELIANHSVNLERWIKKEKRVWAVAAHQVNQVSEAKFTSQRIDHYEGVVFTEMREYGPDSISLQGYCCARDLIPLNGESDWTDYARGNLG